MSDQPTVSNKSSDEEEGSFREESFIESFITQVDGDAIEDLISVQKKSLERFEKTNEMLATCRNLTEKRLEDAKKQFTAGKELINQSKADLESIFQRISHLKSVLADRYPEIYVEQAEKVEQEFPQEAEE